MIFDTNFAEEETRYVRVDVVERTLGAGRRYVQPLDAAAPTLLSGSAPAIWDLLAEHATVNAIVAVLQQRFSDSPDVIARGVQSALDSFVDTKLIGEAS